MPVLLVRHWKLIAMGLLAVAFALQTLRANHYAAKAETCAIARENDRKAYELASKEAEAAQKALNSSISARYSALAEKTHAEHQKELAAARSASERFIAANRLRTPTDRGSTGGPGSPAEGGGPALPDGTAPGAELVAVRADDVMICAADFAYARAAHEFITGLIVNKLAVPAEPIPDPAF